MMVLMSGTTVDGYILNLSMNVMVACPQLYVVFEVSVYNPNATTELFDLFMNCTLIVGSAKLTDVCLPAYT